MPPRRSPFIGLLEGALKLGRAARVAGPWQLDKDALMESATAETGLDDFGDAWFEQPMEQLIGSLNNEAALNTAGQFTAYQSFRKVLKDRLRAQYWFARHPEILARPIPRPVVIVGPMRSGTTRLHRLLASDQRFSHMRSFETISPVPPMDFERVMAGAIPDPRPAIARQIMRAARLANPRTLSIHPTGPFEPEEELGLFFNSFWGMKYEAQWQVPSYGRWCEGQDAAPAYDQLARLLKLVGWSQQTSSIRPWILKTPQHMLDIPALLRAFPDARLIFTHREPQAFVGSAASLAWNQSIIYSNDVCAKQVGREWLGKSALQIERMRAGRVGLAPERMIDVHYDEMEHDWRGTMERIYGFLGFDIAPAWAGMEDFLERSKALKRHPHRYSLAEFGLDEQEVDARFARYIEDFGIPQSARAARVQGRARKAVNA